METLPERQDPFKSFLSWFMSDEDVVRYSDVQSALETVKRGEPCWQAAVSIGVYAVVFGWFGQSDQEKALAGKLAGHAMEPLEALHERLIQQACEKALTDEQARTLFHIRWALGFVSYESGDRQGAIGFLHQLAATQLSRFGEGVEIGGDIVTYTDDMRQGSDLAARHMSALCCEMDEYRGTLSVIAHAARTTGDPLGLLSRVPVGDLLDCWATKCERLQQQAHADDLDPFVEWTVLLMQAGDLLSVCHHADSSGALPRDCRRDSAQFLAYKLGQLAGRFASENADVWQDFMEESDQPGGVDFLVEALLCDLDAHPDWHKLRDRYETGWRRSRVYDGAPVEEIGPTIDLYWAMRLGFADKMLEGAQTLTVSPVPPTAAVSDFQALLDAFRRELDERLPRSGRELRERAMRHLIPVWDVMPLMVLNRLEKAERYYESKVNDDEAKVSFAKAVEAAVTDCFVSPLAQFMQAHGLQQITLPLPPPRNRVTAGRLLRLSLLDWADILGELVTPPRKGLSALGSKELARFIDGHIGPRWPDFGPLAQSLRRVQELRGGSAHYEQTETRLERELWELEEMRKLVLGLGDSPSVIVDVYRFLTPRKQP